MKQLGELLKELASLLKEVDRYIPKASMRSRSSGNMIEDLPVADGPAPKVSAPPRGSSQKPSPEKPSKGKLSFAKNKDTSTLKPAQTPQKIVIELDAGKASGKKGIKGTWHEQLENPEPNTVYKVTSYHDGVPATYTYETDSKGRTVKVTGKLKKSAITVQKERDKLHRNTTTQSKYGGDDPNYDGGHLIGTLFQGPAEKVNLVPQLKDQNRHGEWRQMEKEWAKELDKGREVEVEILVKYQEGTGTPEIMYSNYSVDNGPITEREFRN
ncbi:DNA/RNA non-specific endonuclease [Endozoicomonas arenosclerae]|uniref:DNA/RNA non-specific endonuclease n=1 Tax=Endozoicomonas arenosclerae TaxID=1633495 RepID=UPI00078363FA|nr:DNA/RNA non-specific endonuclease [Endozoicomonas arenosclerae]